MKVSKLALAIAVSASMGVTAAHAERLHLAQRNSFNVDVTRSNSAGMSMHRHTVQQATANGFQRSTSLTNAAGATASRNVSGSYDASSQAYARTVDGVRLNGDVYSAERATQRTEAGFNRSVSRTNAAGETASKETAVAIDKENHSITKNVTAVGFDGKTYAGSVVKTYSKGASGSDQTQSQTQSQDQHQAQNQNQNQNQSQSQTVAQNQDQNQTQAQNQYRYRTQVKAQAQVSAQAQVKTGNDQQESAD